MSHIAFMAVPAHGHVNPGLGLVAELVARGHRVSYATTADFAPQVRESGADPVLYSSVLPSAARQEEWPAEQAAAVGLFVDEMIGVHRQLAASFAEDVPDLVLHDIAAMQAPVLAAQWGVPAVTVSPTHVAFEGLEETLGVDDGEAMRAVHARAEEFFAEQGVEMTFAAANTPRRCIVTIPRSFQYRPDTVGPQYEFVGPMLTDRAFQGTWQAPDERPVLLISMGSAYTDRPELYRACLEAFGGSRWRVVLVIGRAVDPAELGEVPENVELHPWVPQLDVLSKATAFITHAGMGGATEGMCFGVPMVAIPQAADQFANAARIAELGLGAQLPAERATPQALRETLEEVVGDPATAAECVAMREEIRRAGGVRRAVEIVEEELG